MLKRYIFAFIALFFINFEVNAMTESEKRPFDPEDKAGKMGQKRKKVSEKQLRQEQEMKKVQQVIESAALALFDPNPDLKKVISDLEPLFGEDMSLKVALTDYHGEAQAAFAQALWMEDNKIDAAPWFFKAAEYNNDDALQEIGLTSPKALEHLKDNKKKDALAQYLSDLKSLLRTYREDLKID